MCVSKKSNFKQARYIQLNRPLQVALNTIPTIHEMVASTCMLRVCNLLLCPAGYSKKWNCRLFVRSRPIDTGSVTYRRVFNSTVAVCGDAAAQTFSHAATHLHISQLSHIRPSFTSHFPKKSIDQHSNEWKYFNLKWRPTFDWGVVARTWTSSFHVEMISCPTSNCVALRHFSRWNFIEIFF